MTEKQAIQESIEHWKRMIAWAENIKDLTVRVQLMKYYIGETWGGNDCALCQKYKNKCSECPLDKKGYCCNDRDSLFKKVSMSETWGEWVENAKVMLEILESLLKE